MAIVASALATMIGGAAVSIVNFAWIVGDLPQMLAIAIPFVGDAAKAMFDALATAMEAAGSCGSTAWSSPDPPPRQI